MRARLLLLLLALSACDAGPDPYAAEVNAVVAQPSDAAVDRLREDASGGGALSRRFESLVESAPAPGGGTVYPNATRLGYYVRALDAARDAQVEDIRTNGSVLSRLVGHIPNEWLKDVAEMGSERGVEALVERTEATYADLIQHTIPPGINASDGSEASRRFSRARGVNESDGTTP